MIITWLMDSGQEIVIDASAEVKHDSTGFGRGESSVCHIDYEIIDGDISQLTEDDYTFIEEEIIPGFFLKEVE